MGSWLKYLLWLWFFTNIFVLITIPRVFPFPRERLYSVQNSEYVLMSTCCFGLHWKGLKFCKFTETMVIGLLQLPT